MELLSERLTSVADGARRELTSSVIKIIDFIKKELASNTDSPLTRATFHALRTISATTCPGEEISLTSTVPLVLGGMRERTTAAPAIQALSSLWYVIHFHNIVKMSQLELQFGARTSYNTLP